MNRVAALYVDPRGPYPKMQGVDCWDESRDARTYSGPLPIIAHPPCKHWGRLRHLAHVTCGECGWKGRDTYAFCPECCAVAWVSDRDCAVRAVAQVREWDGVLEHPAGSKLWDLGLPRPLRTPRMLAGMVRFFSECDQFGGFSVEVDQVEWGHVARKRTWLYLVGVPREALESPPFPGRKPTHWVSGNAADLKGRDIKFCSPEQRRRTPPLFAEYLVRLAQAAGSARRSEAA